MSDLVRRIDVRNQSPEDLISREWLVTNGLGGYASGTVSRLATRRYHGLLIAALPAPFGRTMMLNHLTELIRLKDGNQILLGGLEWTEGSLELHGITHLEEFRLEMGLPVWRYRINGSVFEKRVLMPHLQNTTFINYRLLDGDRLRLKLRPAIIFRSHDAPVSQALTQPYTLTAQDGRFELSDGSKLPPLRLLLHGQQPAFTLESQVLRKLLYRIEEGRGYESTGDLWSPGYFRVNLSQEGETTLVASTEPWEQVLGLAFDQALETEMERRHRLIAAAPLEAQEGVPAELVLAADQFIITPATRVEDAARIRASGEEARTIIAGYHWFTDWGRDTMISLEGLTLNTGRLTEARYILRTFALHIRNGLIPNFFLEGDKEGLYHTADATLWYFHALERYLLAGGDRQILRDLLPSLLEIVEHHLRGTEFGIKVDPEDGLLNQGAPGYQLTWMDAKVDEWVITPRRGKAVEINALWYNALCLLASWVREEMGKEKAAEIEEHGQRARESFNQRFWYETGGHLFDVIDGEEGDDSACRPNQLLAISLDHPVLDASRWKSVMQVVRQKLLTPVGLRSLSPDHKDFKSKYFGDLRSRDAAYHQGTVWAWLIGPFVDAWIKTYPEDPLGARECLEGLSQHLNQACIGSISEIFDAEESFHPRGCIAQAWSVAEALRSWIQIAKATQPEVVESSARL